MEFNWEDEKRRGTKLFYVAAACLILLCVYFCFTFITLPYILSTIYSCWWLLSYLITVPMCIGVFIILIDTLRVN